MHSPYTEILSRHRIYALVLGLFTLVLTAQGCPFGSKAWKYTDQMAPFPVPPDSAQPMSSIMMGNHTIPELTSDRVCELRKITLGVGALEPDGLGEKGPANFPLVSLGSARRRRMQPKSYRVAIPH